MTLEEIIDGCKVGDNNARKELYERYAGLMYSVLHRYVKDRQVAADLLHDGFITIYTKIGDFSGRGSFEGWCRRIMVNTALTQLRRNDPLEESSQIEATEWLTPHSSGVLDKMSADELLRIIGMLPETQRTVLNLRAVEGYDYEEICQMLDMNENTVRSHYARAKTKLTELLAKV